MAEELLSDPVPSSPPFQVAEELLLDLLSIEEAFGTDVASGVTTEQEVIDGLRKVRASGVTNEEHIIDGLRKVRGGCQQEGLCALSM